MSIVVIGGGIGGLAFAAALIKRGLSCKVYEGDESFESRPGGYSLTIQNAGQKALQDLGLKEALYKLHCRCASYHTLKFDGSTISKQGKGIKKQKSGNVPIPRQTLRSWILNILPENTVIWGERYHSFQLQNNKIEINFESGLKIKADLVVSADGTFSKLRKQIIPNPPLTYLGFIAINGIGTSNCPVFKNAVTQWLDGKHRIFTKPFETNSTMWQLTFAVDEEKLKTFFSGNRNLKKSKVDQISKKILG